MKIAINKSDNTQRLTPTIAGNMLANTDNSIITANVFQRLGTSTHEWREITPEEQVAIQAEQAAFSENGIVKSEE